MTTYSHKAELLPAYLLHSRKYRNTSLIAEFLTERDGRVTAVIRGARGGKKKGGGIVQPFTPLLVNCIGRGELKTLAKMEVGTINRLVGENLLIGLYVNELLIRLLGKYEACVPIFRAYQNLTVALAADSAPVRALREFELKLLIELGYGVTFDVDASGGKPVQTGRYYSYVPDQGFHLLPDATHKGAVYKGEVLLAIAAGRLDDGEVNNSAKTITRAAFAELLGGKPLKSRELFQQFRIKAQGAV